MTHRQGGEVAVGPTSTVRAVVAELVPHPSIYSTKWRSVTTILGVYWVECDVSSDAHTRVFMI